MKKTQKGFTLIELLIVIAVIAILAAIAIPNLLASRKAANESSAVGSLRTLVSAEETYRSRQNQPTYGDLTALQGAGLIDSVLAAGSKSGYTFTGANITANTYEYTADPTTPARAATATSSWIRRASSGRARREQLPAHRRQSSKPGISGYASAGAVQRDRPRPLEPPTGARFLGTAPDRRGTGGRQVFHRRSRQIHAITALQA